MTRIDPLDEYTPQNISYEPRPSAARAPPRPSADNYEPVNSDDELDQQPISAAEYVELERRFEERLRARGLHIRRMLDDGNCLFRSVSDRVYGDAEMHDVVRRLCLDHMEKERDHFSQYVTEDFDAYLRRKRRDRVFGNHLEIQAISEIYNRPVHVFDVRGDTEAPMNTFTAPSEGEAGAPLRLSYHGRSHYNVIVDPTVADVGDGLGLPGFHPGLADRMQVEQAQQASETSAIESQLLLSARDASDVDATQDALLQAALAASAAEAGVGWAGGAGAACWPGAGIGAWAGEAAWGGDASGDASGVSFGGASEPSASCGHTGSDADAVSTVASAPSPFDVHDFAKPPALPVYSPWAPAMAPTRSAPATAAAAAVGAPFVQVGGGGGGSGGGGGGGVGGGGGGGGCGGAGSTGSADELSLSQEVQTLLAMGFSLPRAVQAHAQFGDDLDSMLEFLTSD
eukprot:jgi/Chrpa1/8158/Chrysochromulina_OHIO_Genome00001633-RA